MFLLEKQRQKKEMAKPYKYFQSQGHVKMAYRCSKCNAYYLVSCIRDKCEEDDLNSVR